MVMVENTPQTIADPANGVTSKKSHRWLWPLLIVLILLILGFASFWVWHEAAFIFPDHGVKNSDDVVTTNSPASSGGGAQASTGNAQTVSATKVVPSNNAIAVYVKPGGSGLGNGTKLMPYTSLEAARNGIRPHLPGMRNDIYVKLLSGTFQLNETFALSSADSGQNGYKVVYEAANGASPVISGGMNITGWQQTDASHNIWTAKVPNGFNTRQLYVDGQRAQVAQGTLPVTLTQTATGYTASGNDLGNWPNPQEIEFMYVSGPANWTESRCRVGSISGNTITMVQPCWDNTTKRNTPNTTLSKSFFGEPLTVYPIATNAKALLTKPGQWYLDQSANTVSYIPLAGQNMSSVSVIAPKLQTLVQGNGTASAPVQNIIFRRISFMYAGWLDPSSGNGYSPIQTGTFMTGNQAYLHQGACDGQPQSTCPYMSFPQVPGNVSFNYAHNLTLESDNFEHLGAAGLVLGTGSQGNTVEGNLFTDTSGGGMTLGGVSQPAPNQTDAITNNNILNNYFTNTSVEYQDNAALYVGYSQQTTVTHNQINNVPYSGIAIGWGGWQSNIPNLPPLANYSQGNTVSNNLVFDHVKVMVDGGGIYSNGIQGNSLQNGEKIENNVVMQQTNPSWAIYTDNGSQNINVTNNLVWDALYVPLAPIFLSPTMSPYFSFGGCGGGPITYTGNYSVQSNPAAGLMSALKYCGAHPLNNVTVPSNNTISALSQVPANVVSGAGIESPYSSLLHPSSAPSGLPAFTLYPPLSSKQDVSQDFLR